MTAVRFELTVSLPADARYAATARELVIHAAAHSGCTEARAQALADELASVVRERLAAATDGALLPIVVRLTAGPVEVLVDGRTFSLDPA
jgi:hypothetical protein